MIGNPHDALFKAVFGEPEHARGALRSVVPAALAEAFDWATLERRAGSFVDPALAERHTDLLFSVGVKGAGEALVYVLFEHQSKPEAQMAYRLLRYMVRIWERWQGENPGMGTLPPILPVVLYHGRARWSAPRAFAALVDVPAELREALSPHVPSFSYLLDDLSAVPDNALRARAMTGLAKLAVACLKHARGHTDIAAVLGEWAEVLREVVQAPRGIEALALAMRYTLLVNEAVAPEALQALLEREVGPEGKDTIVSIGQQLIEQGLQQGLAQGGLEGQRTLLLRLLQQRFGGALDATARARIAVASIDEIERWAGHVLTATTLAEVLAG